MRIAHITDLHYSREKNKWDFRELLDGLLKGLETEHAEKKIDLVFITGDLVDRGGSSFGVEDPFAIVQETVIDRIARTLGLNSDRIVISPGNHDVIEKDSEPPYFLKGLRSDFDLPAINNLVDANINEWNDIAIDGLKKFKEFERRFYTTTRFRTTHITHSNFETCFTFAFGKAKIGVVAFNSAWSCSSKLDQTPKYKLAFGTAQIHRAGEILKNTDFNIALMHHPISLGLYNEEEEAEMKTLLKGYNFNILCCGHTHAAQDNFMQQPEAMYYLVVTKAGFNNFREKNEKYKPGFCLIDLSYSSEDSVKVSRHFRKYVSKRFDYDVDEANRGMSTYEIKPNRIGKNFIDYLKSQNVFFDPQRKILFETMNSISQNYIKSPFPEVTDLALRKGLERFLPRTAQFNHIRRNFKIKWEVRPSQSEGYYILDQEQSFDIQSTKDPFQLSSRLFIDIIRDGKDQTSIELIHYKVDGQDIKDKFAPSIEPLEPLDEGGKSFVRERKVLTLNHTLEDKESYQISRKTKTINPLAIKKAWTFYPVNIFQGYEFIIKDPEERFHVELFGMADDLYYSTLREDEVRLKEIRINRPDDILIPGDMFWLFISSY
jgi:predicted MPP superfamily phosphohydrolase